MKKSHGVALRGMLLGLALGIALMSAVCFITVDRYEKALAVQEEICSLAEAQR